MIKISFQSIISLRRRSIATAIQTLISHLCGDAFSPYLIGRISDAIRGEFLSLISILLDTLSLATLFSIITLC